MYTLTYYLYGGINNPSNPTTFEAVDLPITLLDPTKEGYVFSGWYDNPDFIGVPVTQITEEGDDVVYASWTIDQFTLEFVDHDLSVLQTADYDYGADLSAVTPPADPTREGYTFTGWDIAIPATMPANTVTITAQYTINQYTISFEENGGSEVTDITQDYGTVVIEPADPTKEGHTFEQWYDGPDLLTPYVFSTMPAENITLYANWTINQYTITFQSNGGSLVGDITQNYGTVVVAPADPTKANLHFGGWYSDALLTIPYIFTTMPAENVTVYARWYGIVTFDSNEGSEVTQQEIDENDYATEPVDPTRTGYTFDAWYTDDGTFLNEFVFASAAITTDITIYANWVINQYTITFDSNEGSVVAPITQDYDTVVAEPVDPTRTGYTFDAWYTDEELTIPYVFTTMPAEDITLYAGWTINQYTITFEVNGDSAIDPITQDYGTAVAAPAEPTRIGYTFDNWYGEIGLINPYVFTTMPAENITVYVGWTAIEYSIIYLSTYAAVHTNPITFTVEDLDITLLDPTERNGYIFAGWAESINGIKTPIKTVTELRNYTLYAQWKIVGDYVALPVYSETDYSYMVNKEKIVEVNPVTISSTLHRVKVIVSPGTIILLAGLYETYAEALTAAEKLKTLIANIPAAV